MELPNKQKIITELKSKNNVIVLPMRLSDSSKCMYCNSNDDKYAVFIGGTKFSDLQNTSCSECLPKSIDDALDIRAKYITQGIENIEAYFKSLANENMDIHKG